MISCKLYIIVNWKLDRIKLVFYRITPYLLSLCSKVLNSGAPLLCAASQNPFLPLSPQDWRGTVRVRAGGRLPDLRNPYLCNRLTDFRDSKFCGIVYACSCALSWSFAHLPHMGLPVGQKLVKFGTNRVQTLRNAYLWKWANHLKFYGLVSTCGCALS